MKKKWQELIPGGVNYDAGNILKNHHNSFCQKEQPQFHAKTCSNCFFCWLFCPENAIIIENKQVSGINYDYCNGCGICVNECPVQEKQKPLTMIKETIEF